MSHWDLDVLIYGIVCSLFGALSGFLAGWMVWGNSRAEKEGKNR